MFLLTLVVHAFDAFTVPRVFLEGTNGMPRTGLGMCCRESAKGDVAEQAVVDYLQMGGRLIDTAVLYGNHGEIGRGIKRSGVSRGEIFVTTKIWASDFSFERAYESVIRSLQELQLEYIDLVLLHVAGVKHTKLDHPDNPPCLREQDGVADWSLCRKSAWAVLNNLKRTGHARAIGVANFSPVHIQELAVDAQFPVQVNQIEFHPWYPNQDIVEYCQANGIVVTAYGSLGSRRLEDNHNDVSLPQMAAENGRSASQMLLRWALQRNVTVIPGTSNPAHMRENLDIFDFDLNPAAMHILSNVKQHRNIFGHFPDQIL